MKLYGPPEKKETLLAFLLKYKPQFIISSLSGILYNTVIVLGPIFLGKLIDAAAGCTAELVWMSALYYVGITAFFQLARFIKRWFMRDQFNRVACDLRQTLTERVLGRSVPDLSHETAGKTTLLNLIAGVYAPEQGSIVIGGVSPHDLLPEQRRRLVGIVPQNVHIFNGSIRDNITLMDDTITQQQIEEAIRVVGLSKTVDALLKGMDTLLGDGENALSFGQTQLLSLARAIVTNPPLLLLDELTSGLDALTEAQILEAIRTVSKTRTIITISHRLSGILDADIVHIIDKGRIRESGRPEKLTEQEGWYTIYKRLEESGWRMA